MVLWTRVGLCFLAVCVFAADGGPGTRFFKKRHYLLSLFIQWRFGALVMMPLLEKALVEVAPIPLEAFGMPIIFPAIGLCFICFRFY